MKSIRNAALVFKCSASTVGRQLHGVKPKKGSRAGNNLLSLSEEEELVRWILAMEQRGFPAFIINVKRLAETLLSHHGSQSRLKPISKNWTYRFLKRNPALEQRLIRTKDA